MCGGTLAKNSSSKKNIHLDILPGLVCTANKGKFAEENVEVPF